MARVSFVYPNVAEIPQRGGLLERWQLAKPERCEYIEVPADFVKNRTECEFTGLNLGDFIVAESTIVRLYTHDLSVPEELKYILHTEPSLVRRDSYGISYQAPLMWYDKEWTTRFINMVVSISRFLGKPANVVEIHPGDRRNSYAHVITAMEFLTNEFAHELNAKPLVLLENRTDQFISTGKEIRNFWQFLSRQHPYLEDGVGIVLDVQQLYTRTKRKFAKEFDTIPSECIKGLHIHYKHRVPDLSNEIPWKQIFQKITSLDQDILINPEIHHRNKVADAIKFCQSMLRSN